MAERRIDITIRLQGREASAEADRVADSVTGALKGIADEYVEVDRSARRAGRGALEGGKDGEAGCKRFGAGAVAAGQLIADFARRGLQEIRQFASSVASETLDYRTVRATVQNLGADLGAIEAGIESFDATIRDRTQLMGTYFQIHSGGITDTAEAMGMLSATAKLAYGEAAQLSDVAAAGIKVWNVYGDEIKRFGGTTTDALEMISQIAKEGDTNLQRVAGSLPTVLQSAKDLGQGFGEVGAAVALLTRRFKSTEQSTDYLAAVFTSVKAQTAEAAKAAAELGVEWSADALMSKKLSGFVADLAEKLRAAEESGRLSKGQVQELLQRLAGSTEAARALSSLVDAAEDLPGLLESIGKHGGRIEEVFRNMASARGPVDELRNAWQEMQLVMGEKLAPAAKVAIDNLRSIIPLLLNLTNLAPFVGIALLSIYGPKALSQLHGWLSALKAAGPVVRGLALSAAGLIAIDVASWLRDIAEEHFNTQMSKLTDFQYGSRIQTARQIGEVQDLAFQHGLSLTDAFSRIDTSKLVKLREAVAAGAQEYKNWYTSLQLALGGLDMTNSEIKRLQGAYQHWSTWLEQITAALDQQGEAQRQAAEHTKALAGDYGAWARAGAELAEQLSRQSPVTDELLRNAVLLRGQIEQDIAAGVEQRRVIELHADALLKLEEGYRAAGMAIPAQIRGMVAAAHELRDATTGQAAPLVDLISLWQRGAREGVSAWRQIAQGVTDYWESVREAEGIIREHGRGTHEYFELRLRDLRTEKKAIIDLVNQGLLPQATATRRLNELMREAIGELRAANPVLNAMATGAEGAAGMLASLAEAFGRADQETEAGLTSLERYIAALDQLGGSIQIVGAMLSSFGLPDISKYYAGIQGMGRGLELWGQGATLKEGGANLAGTIAQLNAVLQVAGSVAALLKPILGWLQPNYTRRSIIQYGRDLGIAFSDAFVAEFEAVVERLREEGYSKWSARVVARATLVPEMIGEAGGTLGQGQFDTFSRDISWGYEELREHGKGGLEAISELLPGILALSRQVRDGNVEMTDSYRALISLVVEFGQLTEELLSNLRDQLTEADLQAWITAAADGLRAGSIETNAFVAELGLLMRAAFDAGYSVGGQFVDALDAALASGRSLEEVMAALTPAITAMAEQISRGAAVITEDFRLYMDYIFRAGQVTAELFALIEHQVTASDLERWLAAVRVGIDEGTLSVRGLVAELALLIEAGARLGVDLGEGFAAAMQAAAEAGYNMRAVVEGLLPALQAWAAQVAAGNATVGGSYADLMGWALRYGLVSADLFAQISGEVSRSQLRQWLRDVRIGLQEGTLSSADFGRQFALLLGEAVRMGVGVRGQIAQIVAAARAAGLSLSDVMGPLRDMLHDQRQVVQDARREWRSYGLQIMEAEVNIYDAKWRLAELRQEINAQKQALINLAQAGNLTWGEGSQMLQGMGAYQEMMDAISAAQGPNGIISFESAQQILAQVNAEAFAMVRDLIGQLNQAALLEEQIEYMDKHLKQLERDETQAQHHFEVQRDRLVDIREAVRFVQNNWHKVNQLDKLVDIHDVLRQIRDNIGAHQGGGYVPHAELAYLHPREYVVPAAELAAIMRGDAVFGVPAALHPPEPPATNIYNAAPAGRGEAATRQRGVEVHVGAPQITIEVKADNPDELIRQLRMRPGLARRLADEVARELQQGLGGAGVRKLGT